jgi:hypothetical protein
MPFRAEALKAVLRVCEQGGEQKHAGLPIHSCGIGDLTYDTLGP